MCTMYNTLHVVYLIVAKSLPGDDPFWGLIGPIMDHLWSGPGEVLRWYCPLHAHVVSHIPNASP
jgi:hypothetical protein